jgi:flagellar FliL protein
MADEKVETPEEGEVKEKKSGSKKFIIIIAIAAVIALGGGFFTYTQLIARGKEGESHKKEEAKKTALVPLDPFVVNLAEQGRFLKVTMQLELADATNQALATEKVPQFRDAIITLISSKSAEALSSPEGKIQIKDELLLRLNQTAGKDIFKNIYFTEFVMQ